MPYTIEDYKTVCYAAGELSIAVEALQEAQFNIANGGNWTDFGKCLDAVFQANERYNKVNNDCAIAAYERESEDC